MENINQANNATGKVIRSSDGCPVHPSHGMYFFIRLIIGSVMYGWSIMLVFFMLGFLGSLEFTQNVPEALRWILVGGTMLGIVLGAIFSIIGLIVLNLFPALKKAVHPLSIVRFGFICIISWALFAYSAWPAFAWPPMVPPLIALIVAWYSILTNPHSELVPHSTTGRVIGTAVGPFIILAFLLAMIIPAENRAFGEPEPHKLIFIALDGVDEPVLTEILASQDTSRIPNIASIKENHVYGSMSSDMPLIASRLWASMLTGTKFDMHGISDRNSTADDLKMLTLWEILESRDMTVGLFQMSPPHNKPSSAKFDIPSQQSGRVMSNTISRSIMRFRMDGARGGILPLLNLPVNVCELARLGVRLETFDAVLRQLLIESVIGQSWRINYAKRKNLQFLIETDIAIATVRKHKIDASFIRLDCLEPVFMNYKRYARPNEFGPPPSDVDSPTMVGLARVLYDSYSHIDSLFGRLQPFRNNRTTMVIVSNHGVRTPGRQAAQNFSVDTDKLLGKIGWLDRAIWDRSSTGIHIRFPDNNAENNDLSELENLLSKAEWKQPSDMTVNMRPGFNSVRKLFSVSSSEYGLEISLLTSSELNENSEITIGSYNGTLSEILEPTPPSGIIANNGMFLMTGPYFKRGVRADNAYIYDVVPTVLYSLQIDLATYLMGRPLREIFDSDWYDSNPPDIVEDYKKVIVAPVEEPFEESVVSPESVIEPEVIENGSHEYSELPPEMIIPDETEDF